jgi:hypothetical protein
VSCCRSTARAHHRRWPRRPGLRVHPAAAAPGSASCDRVPSTAPGGCSAADTHDRLVRARPWGRGGGRVPDYSLSPEAKYPAAIEQSCAVANGSPSAGRSMVWMGAPGRGGRQRRSNLAAAGHAVVQGRGGPPIRLQLLFYPVTNAAFDSGSYRNSPKGIPAPR